MITRHGGGYKHHATLQELATSANRGCELCSFIDLQIRSSCKEYSPLDGENKHMYCEAYRSGVSGYTNLLFSIRGSEVDNTYAFLSMHEQF
jgi:hypothetical protein